MPSIAAVRDAITEAITAAEGKIRSLQQLIDTLRGTLNRLNELPQEATDLLVETAERTTPLPTRTPPPEASSIDWSHPQLSERRNTQFRRIAIFFLDRKNLPATIRELADEIRASRSAVSNILYRTQKEAFVSQRVEGERRLRAWSLRDDLYRRLSETRNELRQTSRVD